MRNTKSLTPLMNGRIVLKQKNLLYVLCIQRTMLLFENKRFDRYLRQNSGLTLLIETGFKHLNVQVQARKL